jgi:hypothetical protein
MVKRLDPTSILVRQTWHRNEVAALFSSRGTTNEADNQAWCRQCGRGMQRVAEIAPFGREPALSPFLCSDCGATESTLASVCVLKVGFRQPKLTNRS